MLPDLTNAVPKLHPAQRGIAPDDPMQLQGVEVDGDPQLMLRILIEEYARMGFGIEELMNLCRQPFYQGLYGLWQVYGEAELRRYVSDILARCGVFRAVVQEAPAVPDQLLQIDDLPRFERNHPHA
jgi:hypothetical protein